ncbi:MAG: zeta toxin family protein [Verrucomicrobiota bacterium]
MKPLLVMLGGPNGAGKSTFYASYLSALGLPFLNADVLAALTGLAAYEAAARIAEARRVLVERRMGFVTETVFSDPVGAKVDFLAEAVAAGFDVQLIYIGIATADAAARRVAARVQAGGHDVPLEKILSRYTRTLDNLEQAILRLPRVTLYDNSSYDQPFRFLAEFRAGKVHAAAHGRMPRWARRFLQGH